jgi:DNA-binding transcriptional LysR family regulator
MLIAPVRAALQGLYGALESAEGFDPAVSERMFRIAVDNRAALVLVAPLTSAARAIAPRVRLDVRPSGTLDLPDLLDSGDLDLAIGSLAAPADRFADRSLFRDHFVALLRRGHDAAGGSGAIAPETLAALPHLSISSTGEPTDFVDAALQELGLARTIVLRAPLLAAAAALLDSDMVAVISERAARAFAQYLPLAVRDLPFPSPEVPTAALWHRRFDAAPAHRWLRGIVGRVAHAI